MHLFAILRNCELMGEQRDVHTSKQILLSQGTVDFFTIQSCLDVCETKDTLLKP